MRMSLRRGQSFPSSSPILRPTICMERHLLMPCHFAEEHLRAVKLRLNAHAVVRERESPAIDRGRVTIPATSRHKVTHPGKGFEDRRRGLQGDIRQRESDGITHEAIRSSPITH